MGEKKIKVKKCKIHVNGEKKVMNKYNLKTSKKSVKNDCIILYSILTVLINNLS